MELVNVFAAAGQLEAEMIKAFLESQDIEVVLNQESVGRTLGLSAGYLGQVHVMVPESQAVLARTYLRDMLEGKYQEVEDIKLQDDDADFFDDVDV